MSPEKRYGVEDAAVMVVDDNYPMLFGVAIGSKRAREEGRGDEDNMVLSLHQPVQGDKNDVKRKATWIDQWFRANQSECN
ncbi:hypothetical protein RYX36_020809 [Vicia faba]